LALPAGEVFAAWGAKSAGGKGNRLMTAHKHFKHLVRARMGKTGESYTSARRIILQQAPLSETEKAKSKSSARQAPGDGSPTRFHMPGCIPAPTALRVLLTAAGVRDPRDGKPLSEAMVFGIAGGIAIGIAAFRYEKGDFSSFYITGRHLWQDHVLYFKEALKRLGISPMIRETAGAKAADKQLREALASGMPCIAWVRGYHIVTVYGIDDARSIAHVGDLADQPIELPLAELATARSEIKSYKNRLLSIAPAQEPADLTEPVLGGLQACCDGLGANLSKGPKSWATLEALKIWAGRLHGSKEKESWARMFPRGHLLWQGLTSIHDYIEHHRTGGGLSRPMFAEFLTEASQLPGMQQLREVADHYAQLGAAWTALAEAALPPKVPAFEKARELLTCQAELRSTGDSSGAQPREELCKRISDLGKSARDQFPLSEAESDALLQSLQQRVMALYEGEVAARDALADCLN